MAMIPSCHERRLSQVGSDNIDECERVYSGNEYESATTSHGDGAAISSRGVTKQEKECYINQHWVFKMLILHKYKAFGKIQFSLHLCMQKIHSQKNIHDNFYHKCAI